MFVKIDTRLVNLDQLDYLEVVELVANQWYVRAHVIGGGTAYYTQPTYYATQAEAEAAMSALVAHGGA